MDRTRSTQLYEEYQKARELEEKADRANGGMNLINADSFNKPKVYHVHVVKTVEQNLLGCEERISVISDLPFLGYEYNRIQLYGHNGNAIPDFLKDLEEWVSVPQFSPTMRLNRRRENERDRWNMARFREYGLRLSDVTVSVGETALEHLRIQGMDFRAKVEELLLKQREATVQEASDFRRYLMLFESVDDLKRQVKRRNNGYSYGPAPDKTIMLSITPAEYNRKVMAVARELKGLCRRYWFLKMPPIRVYKKKKVPTLKQFVKENESDLQESWDALDDTEKGEDFNGNIKEFHVFQYKNWMDANDMDDDVGGYDEVSGDTEDEECEEEDG